MLNLKQRGDTLVEVAMAGAILAVVIATAFNIANLSYRVGVQARERTVVGGILQQQAEQLRSYRDNLVTDFPNITTNPPNIVDAKAPLCSAATPCHMQANAVNSLPLTATGAQGAYQPVNGTLAIAPFYTSQIVLTRVDDATRGKIVYATITVTWVSSISTVTNTSSLKIALADIRGLQPVDCSVAGSGGVRCQ